MSPREHPTEIDQLLPSPKEHRPLKRDHDYSNNRMRGQLRLFVIAAACLALFGIFNVISRPATHKYHKTTERSYKPQKQLAYLNKLTESNLGDILVGLSTQAVESVENVQPASDSPAPNMFKCSSQVMIMRHCDKDVKVKDNHGKIRVRDKRDIFGDGHCSSKGKERSNYISTLFVDNDQFQGLVNGTKETVDNLSEEGVPPIPAVNATDTTSEVDVIKPQFPTPLKIYALNDARYNKNPSKEHQNFREVETVTPLADKFHLDVNESFGVNEEGDLAVDFFTSLSKSVKMSIDKALSGVDPNVKDEDLSKDDSKILRFCQNGMTVVNWKHSLIPNLARALGCGKAEGCPKKYHGHDFDTVWVITYTYSIPLTSSGPQQSQPAIDAASAPLDVEALSKGSSKASKEKHHRQLKTKSSTNTDVSWVISAQTVQEGFDQVY